MRIEKLTSAKAAVYDYRKKCYTTAEALMRLQDENGQYIPPYEAIRVAEKNNLVTEVGELVLRRACKTMKFLSSQGTSIENITVNLSVQQLVDQNYGKKTLNIIHESAAPPTAPQYFSEIFERRRRRRHWHKSS